MRTFNLAGTRGNLYAQRAKEVGLDRDGFADLHEAIEWEERANAWLGSLAMFLLYATPIVAIEQQASRAGGGKFDKIALPFRGHALNLRIKHKQRPQLILQTSAEPMPLTAQRSALGADVVEDSVRKGEVEFGVRRFISGFLRHWTGLPILNVGLHYPNVTKGGHRVPPLKEWK
jgi:hypothetical protein